VRFVEREPGVRAFLPGGGVFVAELAPALGPGVVLHDHGLWLPTNHAVARAGARAGAPRVVSVRGMLSEWALQAGGVKKKVAWWAYQRQDLQRASALHATSEDEVRHIRDAGLRPPVALVPNGVALPATSATHGADGAPRRALFLSRLHPVKGLEHLVRAWAQVRPPGWELVLAGPDDGGHRSVVEALVRELGVADATRFTGPVGDDAKWDLYRSADLFVLPTFSENFGIVVAEALAAGVPVITTTGAPWQELEARDCGWWVEIGVEPLAQALAEATSLAPERRRAMGHRGRALVEERYSWGHVAEQMHAVYAWLLGQGPRPDCVVD
jgi:glycosyltransferase involved in cell wall biosynthesis